MTAKVLQQSGLACEECRRRKSRCDRARPQCKQCAESGTKCVVISERPRRGPKKGQLKALRNRVSSLEQQLCGQIGFSGSDLEAIQNQFDGTQYQLPEQIISYEWQPNAIENMGFGSNPSVEHKIDPWSGDEVPDLVGLSSIFTSSDLPTPVDYPSNDYFMQPGQVQASEPYTPSQTSSTGSLNISDLARADLDQLYFDRVHPITPIIHKRRYFSWAGQEHLDPARECVRSAMRTMAAAVSTTFGKLSKPLYLETRRMLETINVLEPEMIQIEQIQAGLLMAHYEFMHMYEHQAMLTAGRTFRLVNMLRLHDLDVATRYAPPTTMTDENFVQLEEKRRTFWLAFAFDRFLNTRNEWPLMLNEDMICTRLPAPETNFQNSQPIQVDFLRDAIANSGRSTLSPFAECIVLTALYERCITYRRLVHAAVVSGTNTRDMWIQVEWLSSKLDQWTQMLVQTSPVSINLVERDPMLCFADILTHSATIHLFHTTQAIPAPLEYPCQSTARPYEKFACQAAGHIVRLSKEVIRLSCVKLYSFLPNALSTALVFLMNRAKLGKCTSPLEETGDEIEHLLNALRSLKDVNVVAHDILLRLEIDAL